MLGDNSLYTRNLLYLYSYIGNYQYSYIVSRLSLAALARQFAQPCMPLLGGGSSAKNQAQDNEGVWQVRALDAFRWPVAGRTCASTTLRCELCA